MTSTRLTLALLGALSLAASGCFGSHGMDEDRGTADGGPADGGGAILCELRDGFIQSLECISPRLPGERPRVRIEHSTGVCCDTSTPRPTARRQADGSWLVESAFDACECCEACRCAATPVTSEIELDIPLVPRTVHTVRAGDFSCEIVIEEPAMCSPGNVDEVYLPRALFTDQPVPATLTASFGSGCGCEPSTSWSRGDSGTFILDMRLCGCCELCDCIDAGYQASVVDDPLDAGHYEVATPAGVRQLSVFDPAAGECLPIAPTGLRIVAPRDDLASSGPRLTWAVVEGTMEACCAEPVAGVRELAVGAVGTHLELLSCVMYDCACIGKPTPLESWHSLGELASGTHVVFAGEHSVTFEVP